MYSGVPQKVHVFRPACNTQTFSVNFHPTKKPLSSCCGQLLRNKRRVICLIIRQIPRIENERAHLEFFGETKINKFDVALAVQEKVLGFQVAVNDTATVQIIKGLHHTSRVETRGRIIKGLSVPGQIRFELVVESKVSAQGRTSKWSTVRRQGNIPSTCKGISCL